MKQILSLFLLAASANVFASTVISSGSISGVWTLSGSPYLVQVPTTVHSGSSLTIEPGVVVKFSPEAKIDVEGTLIAKGNAANKIVFQAVDTTGWGNDNTTNGGWGGIHYKSLTTGVPDSSAFEHCIVQDCKYGFSFVASYYSPFFSERKIKIKNCDFHHNTAGLGLYGSGAIISLYNYTAGDTSTMENCIVYQNSSISAIVDNINMYSSYSIYKQNHFYENTWGSTLHSSASKCSIDGNEFDYNYIMYDGAPLKVEGELSITNNKIHHNRFDKYGAIHCNDGVVNIDNNIISNNRQSDTTNCGALYCTSGIYLSTFDTANTYYLVRNNIIANNQAQSGGSALSIANTKAYIVNNTIVNNNASGRHRTISITAIPGAEAADVYIKNNIITSPFWTASVGTLDSANQITIHNARRVYFDYNYIVAPYSRVIYAYYPYTIWGDTSHNIVGTQPDFVNPTLNDFYLTDATVADFSLKESSQCIDVGDTSNANCTEIDYLGGTRINNALIDLGAIEFKKVNGLISNGNTKQNFSVYPNPAKNALHVFVEHEGTLNIIDVSGKTCKTQEIINKTQEIPIADLPSGLYILKFTYNSKIDYCRLIIE